MELHSIMSIRTKKIDKVIYNMSLFKDGEKLDIAEIACFDDDLHDNLLDDIEEKLLCMNDNLDKNDFWIDIEKQAIMSILTGPYFPKSVYKFYDAVGNNIRFNVDPYSFYKVYQKNEYENKFKHIDNHTYEVEIKWNSEL